MMSFQKILDKYRKISFSERDKGDRFERLMQAYLQTDPQYVNLFSKVWLWKNFPGKSDLGGGDTGIDLVALTKDGDYWAIQCKCYQEDSIIDKPAVDSFLSTSSREFKNENLQTTRFAHRLWISTTNRWGSNATEAIKNQNPAVSRINLINLIEAPVDWEKLDAGIHGEASRTPRKSLFPHQIEALEKTHEYFKTSNRGKLIMACGTGKTFTSLRIAEYETDNKGVILFLVPSIALLGQTLREWSADANEPINGICICSDPEISRNKKKNPDADTFSVVDLALPASTDPNVILYQFNKIKSKRLQGMTVVFSTYQSIDVIARVQKELIKNGYPEFDLIISDEAHRTTGVTLVGEDESAFTKVHDDTYIRAKQRLYMTATPRLYSDDTKSKAAKADAVLCSMDDPKLYGEEIYRIGFGEAVERDLLTDYKVLILTLNDKDIPPAIQRMITDKETEINTDDASKLIGCINALSKQFLGDDGKTKESDPEPMRRAVAFCQSIAVSKKITATYNSATDVYLSSLPLEKKEQMVTVSSRHMDGTMSAPIRDEMLGWLKEQTDDNECRILTNVRVLSEGVDVPSLDAVLFLSAKNSQVDVVQSVGRVMRKAPGKKYGYIIIPVVVPTDVEADKALDDNERYRVVWTVLNALRAHDDRFNATVNKIELNKKRPSQILVGRPEIYFDGDGHPIAVSEEMQEYQTNREFGHQMALQFEQLQSVVFARMVQKVGDRRYWEQWAKDVAVIAERQIERIQYLISEKSEQRGAFESFLTGLKKNINSSITETQAVEMLAQHIITKPIFESLFEGYSFVKNNAVSTSMQTMLSVLEGESLAEESDTLKRFYDSVKKRASGIDNAEGKQRIIIELYDKFFKTAFPRMVEQLGIVYTPVEVVDFILNSVNDVLMKEFGRSISDENIHILDPFTGTGTFITRLLQSGLIKEKDLKRKYGKELHANEIVLLAYYIAAVNIENTYHDKLPISNEYESFEGIVLTDSFQLGETDGSEGLFTDMFSQNSARVMKQKKTPIRVIIGNPPYSVGQKSANDNAANQKYEKLDARVGSTYAEATESTNKNSLYNSYIKAFRWATDRLGDEGGIIAFVTDGGWLENNVADGFRKVLEKEFSSIWVFNTRGNARTKGELRRKEAGNVFGGGSRTPIAISILVKNPKIKTEKAKIYYHDIGDYHSREEKLAIIHNFQSIKNPKLKWNNLLPNEFGDWVNKRSSIFELLIPLSPKKKFDLQAESFFTLNSLGINTNRDSWVFNSSKSVVLRNMKKMIENYNKQVSSFIEINKYKDNLTVTDFIDMNPKNISWSSSLIPHVEKGNSIDFEPDSVVISLYRPFFKQYVYMGEKMIHRRGQSKEIFPTDSHKNRTISISGYSSLNEFTPLATNVIPDYHFNGDTHYFPLYYFEKQDKQKPTLFDSIGETEYIRRDGISDFILNRCKKVYGKNVTKEDIFYYVYGILHHQKYRTNFANDLRKSHPRIPLVEEVKDFWKFSKVGRQLADLHIDYERVLPYEGVQVTGVESGFFKVEKMIFPKKDQRDTIIYNSKITITKIPEKAYKYVVNGKSAIEWIMERYQKTVNKDSGIINDPNDWAEEVGNPRYILDLLLSLINVSMQTVDLVQNLPDLEL